MFCKTPELLANPVLISRSTPGSGTDSRPDSLPRDLLSAGLPPILARISL